MLQHLLDSATTRPTEALLLFFLAFLREDVAVVLGGLLIVEHDCPGPWRSRASMPGSSRAISCSSASAGWRGGARGSGI